MVGRNQSPVLWPSLGKSWEHVIRVPFFVCVSKEKGLPVADQCSGRPRGFW